MKFLYAGSDDVLSYVCRRDHLESFIISTMMVGWFHTLRIYILAPSFTFMQEAEYWKNLSDIMQ